MRHLPPPVRAAAAALALVTVLAAAAVGLHLTRAQASAREAARREAAAVAGAVASTLTGPPATQVLRRAAEAEGLAGLVVLDGEGRLLAASDPDRLRDLRWSAVLGGAREVAWAGETYPLAVRRAGPQGPHVAALADPDRARAAFRREALVAGSVAFVVWALVAAAVAGLAWVTGPKAEREAALRLRDIAGRLAGLDPAATGPASGHRRQLIEAAEGELGPLKAPLLALSDGLDRARAEAAETKGHAGALLQINPHYVVLCTLDGQIVDANPAFYAVTGLPFEGVRGGRIEILEGVFPVGPLLDLARRSHREGSSISGIEYALINRDEQRRPVLVSLRGVTVGGRPAVMIQATDVATQRTLENQVTTFTDALDLMVDQRVAQLTSGNAALDGLLDDAGIVVVSFDANGGTRRWSRAAEVLTGRAVGLVPHAQAFIALLDLPPEGVEAFSAWFWGDKRGAFRADIRTADGTARRFVWRKGLANGEGHADRRVLVGVELPAPPRPAGGDGAGEAAPEFTTISKPR